MFISFPRKALSILRLGREWESFHVDSIQKVVWMFWKRLSPVSLLKGLMTRCLTTHRSCYFIVDGILSSAFVFKQHRKVAEKKKKKEKKTIIWIKRREPVFGTMAAELGQVLEWQRWTYFEYFRSMKSSLVLFIWSTINSTKIQGRFTSLGFSNE